MRLNLHTCLSVFCVAVFWTVPVRVCMGQVALTGQVELARLVDVSAQRLGVRISYDDQVLKGRVTLRQDGPISDAELWQLTSRLLAEQGYTTIRRRR